MFTILKTKLIKWLLNTIDPDRRNMHQISDDNDRKFTHVLPVKFNSDFASATHVFRTVPYAAWVLRTENVELVAADKHLVQTTTGLKWICDLAIDDIIITEYGHEPVVEVYSLGVDVHMYDVQIDSDDHLYYANSVMSHNTTCASIYMLWHAMFKADQTILIAAHKFSGSQEIMQRVRYVYESCPDFIRAGVKNYNKGSIEFDNESRIISTTTTGTTGRGMSISLLFCDEFAYVPPNMAEEFWASISPTLATGGRAIITSTPNSDEDVFAQIWKAAENRYDDYGNDNILGTNGFFALKVLWDEHPDRDEEWSKREISKIGDIKWRREYMCEFITFDESLIDPVKLSKLTAKDPVVSMGQTRWFKKPVPGMTYTVALDPAMGTGGDYSAIQIFEVPSYIQVGEWRHNGTNIPGQIRILKDICDYIAERTRDPRSIYWSVENNVIGEAALIVIEDLGEENIPGLFVSEPIRKGMIRKYRKGFNTTHSSKLAACSRMKTLVETGKMTVNSGALISEFKTYVSTASSYRAKSGCTDDLISALLLIIRMIVVLKDWDPRVYQTFKSIESEDDWEPPMPIYISSYR